MDRRDAMLSLLDPDREAEMVPAGFFVHFGPEYRRGADAIQRHLDYFRHTGMDFMKVQYEDLLPRRPDIREPSDWASVEPVGREFFSNQLEVLEGLIDAVGHEVLVLQSTYSPFSLAAFTTGFDVITRHLREDPEAVLVGLDAVKESLLVFVRECAALGVDGFYASTHGGDETLFGGSPIFDEYIKPHDVALMSAMDDACIFNILHVCDAFGPYPDIRPLLDFPGHVVTKPMTTEELTWEEAHRLFGRPVMGGMDRLGVIVHGSEAAIVAEVESVLDQAPGSFILGADCTLPDDVDWDNIRLAIETAHRRARPSLRL